MIRSPTWRARSWLALALAMLLLPGCPQSEPTSDSTGEPIWRGDDLTSVVIVDASNALVAGRSGAIYRTADAGETWSLARPAEKPALEGLAWVEGGTGWAVGGNGVLRTEDGGRSWQSLELVGVPPAKGLRAVAALDALGAVVVGDRATVLVTRDGGRSWHEASLESGVGSESGGPDAPALSDVACGPERSPDCWIVGEAGTIAYTQDGGLSWQPGSIESAYGFDPVELAPGRTDLDSEATRRLAQFAESIRDEADQILEIEAVTDLGEIERLGRPEDPFALFEILDARAQDARTVLEEAGLDAERLVVRGEPPWSYQDYLDDEPEFLARYWQARLAPKPGLRVRVLERPDLKAVHFVDPLHGWAVGDEDEVFRTSDGGRRWQTVGHAGSHALHAMSAGRGGRVIVGAQGAIRVAAAEGTGWLAPASRRAPIHFDDYLDVAFSADGGLGFIVGERGWLLRSVDGGVNWEALPRVE